MAGLLLNATHTYIGQMSLIHSREVLFGFANPAN